MPNWKKLVVSGSDASLNSLNVATSVTASVVSSSFTGSLFGTSSWAVTASHAVTSSYGLNPRISGSLNNADAVIFNTAASVPLSASVLTWDSGEGSLQLGLAGGNVDLTIGEQLYQYVYNAQGTTLTKGQVVYSSGSQGGRIAVKLASATAEFGSANTLGLVAETILAGAEGWVITEGSLKGLNTLGLTSSPFVYLSSSAGQYTSTSPQAPLHNVRLGVVQKVDAATGAIYVKIDNGYESDELHDVILISGSNGDLLVRSGSYWINTKQLTGSYELTGSLSVSSSGVGLTIYGNQEIWANAATLQISNKPDGGSIWGGPAIILADYQYASKTQGANLGSIYFSDDNGNTLGSLIAQKGTNSGKLDLNLTYNTSGNSALYVDGDLQNVGIRNVSPSYSLDVSGSGNYSGGLTVTGSINVSGSSHTVTGSFIATSFTGSLFGTSSWAVNAINGFPFTGSAVISGSLEVTGSLKATRVTSSLFGTASWASNFLTSSVTTASYANNFTVFNNLTAGNLSTNVHQFTGSISLSGSYLGDFAGGYGFYTAKKNNHITQNAYYDGAWKSYGSSALFGSAILFQTLGETGKALSILVDNAISTANEALSFSEVFSVGTTGNTRVTGSLGVTGSISVLNGGFTGSLFGTASWASNFLTSSVTSASLAATASLVTGSIYTAGNLALSASFAVTASHAISAPLYLPLTGGTINGDLTINGTASINYLSASTIYITASQLNLGTNLITVNTMTGSALRFGGLAVIDSGSVPQQSGSILYDSVQDEWIFVHRGASNVVTSSHFLVGPETYNSVGDEIYIPQNYLVKSTGNEHMTSASIVDNGSTIRTLYNTEVTGSLNVSSGVTASLLGTSSWSSNSITASLVTGSIFQSGNLALSSSYAVTASYVLGAVTSTTFPYTGSAIISGSLEITGSIRSSDLINGSILFATASGQITQSNDNLFWDTRKRRLGVGTNIPASGSGVLTANQTQPIIHVNTNYTGSVTASIINNTTTHYLFTHTGSSSGLTIAVGNTAGGNRGMLNFYKNWTTNFDTPTTGSAVNVGDRLGVIRFVTADGTGASSVSSQIEATVDSTADVTKVLSRVGIFVGGGGASLEALKVYSSGNTALGSSISSDNGNTLQVAGRTGLNGDASVTGSLIVTVGAAISGNFSVSSSTATVSGSLTVTGSLNATRITSSLFGTASWASNVTTALTASSLNPLNQGSVIITGSLFISGSNSSLLIGGNVTSSTEASLIIGIPPNVGTGEGGQIILQAPNSGGFTSASMLDNYQNQFRILRGNNTASDAAHFVMNMHNGQSNFYTSLAIGNITPSSTTGRLDAANDVVAFSTSDERFKTNVSPITNALDKIKSVSGVEFDWIPNEEHHGFTGHDVGVIAQEVERVLPEVVTTRPSGYKAVKYEKIVALLIQAIKEQQEEIEELKRKIK